MHFTLKFVSGLELQGGSVKVTEQKTFYCAVIIISTHTAQPWPVVMVRLTEREREG